MSEHTKGKWEVINTSGRELGVRNEDGFICFLPVPFKYADQEERYKEEMEEYQANAELIAAAPKTAQQRDDLLAASEQAIKLLKEWNAESTIKAQEFLESAIAGVEK